MESKIVGYRGIANADVIIISGHAFEKHKVKDTIPQHGRRKNFRQAIRRFRARPLTFATVDIQVVGITKRVRTNHHGYFTCELSHELKTPGWYPYELFWKRNDKRFIGEFYLSDEHETGVISDIDDTLLISHSTQLLRKLTLVLFRNAHTRKVIPYLAKWYHHLSELNNADHPNDFFYVSNSEWNLYDFLIDFFAINQLPKGVFFLQKLKKGLRDMFSSGKSHKSHKLTTIEFLLRFYPNKSFILVGDNGQRDMEIYSILTDKFPARVKGVMIRKLPYIKNEKRLKRYEQKITAHGVPFITFY
ncbi:MAG: phosphatase domain-containing protein [Cyclobacteriaceae bacterium]|nr:phosphatase domain-containing protein [Cyclobacteriaceae bacterium]